MRRLVTSVAAGLAAALLFHPGGVLANNAPMAPPAFGGRYLEAGDSTKAITITPLATGVYQVISYQWQGVGLFDGTSYWGVFRLGPPSSDHGPAGVGGTHRGLLGPDGSLAVHGEFTEGRTGSFDTVWKPEHGAVSSTRPGLPIPVFENPIWPPPSPSEQNPRVEHPIWPRDTPLETPDRPNPGDYVYVEELPEALTKVAPVYPQAARDARIQGTVVIQALVGRDGRIKDSKVVRSVPGLDEAAEACVRQWVFKPALSKNKPVAVWVAVPVRFSLP